MAENRPQLLKIKGRRLAAPSWVIPGTILENCLFLSGRVDEVGLCFFEAESCLAYGAGDLPPMLSSLPLSWHVHLPLDLDWTIPTRAAGQAIRLMDKVAFLGARRAVLHPPPASSGREREKLLSGFVACWKDSGREPSDIFLENTRQCPLVDIEEWLSQNSLHVCLDMGHLLKYKQEELLERPGIMRRVAMLHANAVDLKNKALGRHVSLRHLDGPGMDIGRRVCRVLPEDAVLMLEFFSWPEIEESVPILSGWIHG